MVDHIVEVLKPAGRIEIRTGVGRRRRWSEEDKGRIVAESFAPGAKVSEVARRYEITPQHLFAWRKAARSGSLVLPSDAPLEFVPVVTQAHSEDTLPATIEHGSGAVTIEIGGAIVRAAPGVGLNWLGDVLRVVKASL